MDKGAKQQGGRASGPQGSALWKRCQSRHERNTSWKRCAGRTADASSSVGCAGSDVHTYAVSTGYIMVPATLCTAESIDCNASALDSICKNFKRRNSLIRNQTDYPITTCAEKIWTQITALFRYAKNVAHRTP